MEEQSPIRLSVQLPAGTLEGLTRLVEQLRYLAEAVGGTAAAPAGTAAERGQNPAFDTERFGDLLQRAGTSPEAEAQTAGTAETGDSLPVPVPREAAPQETALQEAETASAPAVWSAPDMPSRSDGGGFSDMAADGVNRSPAEARVLRDPQSSGGLTADEMSYAFQKDGRRYDSGFPLY